MNVVKAAIAAMRCIQTTPVCKQAEGECIQTCEASPVQREVVDENEIILEIMRGMVGHGLNLIFTHKETAEDIFYRLKNKGHLRTEPMTVSLEKFTLTGEQIMRVHKRWMDAGCPGSILVDSANARRECSEDD